LDPCDDDLPWFECVENILRAREEFKEPGLIYLRVKGSDERVSDYTRIRDNRMDGKKTGMNLLRTLECG